MPALAEKQRLLTVDEYRAMGCAGIIAPDERVELIDGLIIPMSPIGDPHVDCVNSLTYLFTSRLYTRDVPPQIVVSVQNPVRLNDYTEPEPDIVLIRPNKAGVPNAEDALLVVEVADTTLSFDRGVKLPRYAAAGIPEVWIVALEEDHIEVYRKPGLEGYEEKTVCVRGEAVTIEALPEAGAFAVDAMLRP